MLLKSGFAVTVGLTLALLAGAAQAGSVRHPDHRCWHRHHHCSGFKPHHRDNGHDRNNVIHGKDNGHDRGNAVHGKDNGHDRGNGGHVK